MYIQSPSSDAALTQGIREARPAALDISDTAHTDIVINAITQGRYTCTRECTQSHDLMQTCVTAAVRFEYPKIC